MNNNRFMSSSNAQATQIDLGLRSYMLGVYNHMTTALALTGFMAMGLNFLAISDGALTPIGELFFLSPLKWVVMLAPLGMVFYISARINSISAEKARSLFYVYAGLMGLSISSLLLVYTGASVVRAFFVTAAAFAALSIYGYTTKKSLSGLGSFFETSSKKNIDKFAKIIMDAGFASPIRKPRGQDIYAACGQLKSETEKIRKSQINKLVPLYTI